MIDRLQDINTQPEAWEPEPVPLTMGPTLPPFPVSIFPTWLGAEVDAVATFTQTPADLAAMAVLGVLSAAAGGHAVVEVRPGWHEPVNLYVVTALPPGSRKSPVFGGLTEPVFVAEKALAESAKAEILEAQAVRDIRTSAATVAKAAAAKATGPERARLEAEAIAAAALADAIEVPPVPRLVADDITAEAMATLLAEQRGVLAILSAEGGLFSILAGRYSGTPNLDVFLKAWSGDPFRIDRRGRPPEHVDHPALTLGLAVQPEVLTQIAGLPGFRGRGLLARLLYAVPGNTVGSRTAGAAAVPPEVQAAYAANVEALVASLHAWTDPMVLRLTPEAASLHLAYERDLEPRLHPETGDLAGIVDWASKLVGSVARVAGLLHLATHLRDGHTHPVDVETMAAAIEVGDYLLEHARAAFDQMGLDRGMERARSILVWLRRTRPETFSRREAFRALAQQTKFSTVADLDEGLDILEEHEYVRKLPPPPTKGPGRPPSPVYEVNTKGLRQ